MGKSHQDLTSYGAAIPEEIFSVGLLDCSNLDLKIKVQIEGMEKPSADGKAIEGEKVEEILLRFKSSGDESLEINFTDLQQKSNWNKKSTVCKSRSTQADTDGDSNFESPSVSACVSETEGIREQGDNRKIAVLVISQDISQTTFQENCH